VEFYKITNPFLELPVEGRYPEGSTLDITGIKAEYNGSDFNYIYSEALRKEIEQNCEEGALDLLELNNYDGERRINFDQILDNGPNNGDNN